MTRSTLGLLWPVAVLALLASPWTISVVSAQAQSRKTILAVHWGPEDHPGNLVMDRAIREVVASQSDEQIDYFAEYLETGRFGPEAASGALIDYLRQKFHGRRIDLVIATTAASLDFVLAHQQEPFLRGPIVFTVPTHSDATRRLDRARFTGVLRGRNYAATLRLALELHPDTQRVFVVARSPNDLNFQEVQNQLSDFSQRVRLTYLTEETLPALMAAIKAIPPRSLVLYVWYLQADAGTLVHPDEAARLVAEASPVPVYGTGDIYVGTGVVGGLVRATHPMAARLGQMALEILTGKSPADIPIETASLLPIFDWRQLQRWDVDPSRLPPGSDIRFRTPTLWESNRLYVSATVLVVVAQLALIAGLLLHRAKRLRAERTIREREATLRSSYDRIRNLNGRLITAQETARAEIARELHDGVCQELACVSLGISGLKHSSGRIRDARTQTALSELEQSARDTIDGVRRLSHDLHPAVLRLLGLASALKAHCLEAEQRHDVQVGFQAIGDFKDIHPDVSLCLFRIAQETLRNGAVHGRARRLGVSIARTATEIELIVFDDGQGFDLEAVRREGRGLGLVSMEERAHLVGGEVQILTNPGEGTSIAVRVPALAAEHAPQEVLPFLRSGT